MGHQVMVHKEVDVDVEIDLEDIDIDSLLKELNRRGLADNRTVLQRILWEHDILGIPLDQVVDQMMHEYGMTRRSASEALAPPSD